MEDGMLDDLQKIHECDVQDALGIAAKEWEQFEGQLEITPALQAHDVHNVVYGAMGGSALAALFVPTWPTCPVPFEVVRNYDLPSYVGPNTLFIACSYSGNTEETIEALGQAEARGAQIAVIAGGGKLADIAREKNFPLVLLPKVQQPRFAVFANLKALIELLEQAGLYAINPAELQEASEFLKTAVEAWLPTVATKDNLAKQIALECIGKSVVVYGGPKMAPAAYKWKIGINESAKQVAWWGQFPEFNHNEFIGWSKMPEHKPYAVIDLRSSLEHPRVQKRFEVTERLLSGLRPSPIVVQEQGDTILKQMLYAVMLGDFVSVYTGILNGVNPTPVELVEKFKKVLAE
jgi:glucose/mannose-6-phosphate isomerase